MKLWRWKILQALLQVIIRCKPILNQICTKYADFIRTKKSSSRNEEIYLRYMNARQQLIYLRQSLIYYTAIFSFRFSLNPHEDNFLLRQRYNTKKWLSIRWNSINISKSGTKLHRTDTSLVEKRPATNTMGPVSSMSMEWVDEIFSNVLFPCFRICSKYMSILCSCWQRGQHKFCITRYV